MAVIDELARRKRGRNELGAIDDRIQPAFQKPDQVFGGVALAPRGLVIDAAELLFGQVAVVAFELLLGAQLQAEIGNLLLAALTVLARTVSAFVDRGFRATTDVFAHTAVEFVLGAVALGHIVLFFDPSRRFRSWKRDCNGGFRVNPS